MGPLIFLSQKEACGHSNSLLIIMYERNTTSALGDLLHNSTGKLLLNIIVSIIYIVIFYHQYNIFDFLTIVA